MVRTTRLVLASVMGLSMVAGGTIAAYAQDDKGSKISMDMDQVDVREAVRALFKSVNLSYSVAPEVQGTVTVNLHGVTFETALQNILKQVNATYRKEAGVYQIVLRELPVITPEGQEPGPKSPDTHVRRHVKARSADPMFIAEIISQSQTNFSLAPEISTVLKTPRGGSGGGFGGGFGGGNGGNNGFGGNGGNNGFGGNNGGGNFGGNFGGNNNGPGSGRRGG